MENDINAIEGLLKNIEVLALAGIDIAEDGVDMTDLPAAVGLLSEINPIIANFKAVGEAFDEAKDIDAEEAIALLKRVYEIGKKVELALRK